MTEMYQCTRIMATRRFLPLRLHVRMHVKLDKAISISRCIYKVPSLSRARHRALVLQKGLLEVTIL